MPVETESPNIRAEFQRFTIKVANCPNLDKCRADCPKLDATKFPSPDFVGRRYRGLVIVGGNPGNAYDAATHQSDIAAEQIMERVRQHERPEDAETMLDYYPKWMLSWKQQLVNAGDRDAFDYDIEEVAYLNLVKCKTVTGSSKTIDLVGEAVFQRCWQSYARRQLEALRPKFIVGLWLPVRAMLAQAGFNFRGIQYAAQNGQRSLSKAERVADVKRLFEAFKREKSG